MANVESLLQELARAAEAEARPPGADAAMRRARRRSRQRRVGVVALGLALVFGVLGLQARHLGGSRGIARAAKPAVVHPHPFGPTHGVPVKPSILHPGSHLVGPVISLGSGSLRVGSGTEVYRWRATAQAATPRTGRSMGEACISIVDFTGRHGSCGPTTLKFGVSFHNPPGVHVLYGAATQKAVFLRVWVEGSARAITVKALSAGALPVKFFVVVIPQSDKLAALEPLDAGQQPLCRYEPLTGGC